MSPVPCGSSGPSGSVGSQAWPRSTRRFLAGLLASVVLHALAYAAASGLLLKAEFQRQATEPAAVQVRLLPPPPEPVKSEPEASAAAPVAPALVMPSVKTSQIVVASDPDAPRPLATMAAPPAPTPEEWAFAGRYALKNNKAYRYTWGQQVRSMMGTVVEGPDQGMVRFRVEIAPDGSLSKLDTLWSTSPVAERLARQAVSSMPRWPATPTGEPLVFEKTISFTPFATDDPPLYKNDCLPDPPEFSNPFAWDGQSAQATLAVRPSAKPDPKALEDCLRQLPQDSIEAESARDRRMFEQWGWGSTPPDR